MYNFLTRNHTQGEQHLLQSLYMRKLSYQLINKNFRSIERFRSVEFNRDFNLSSITPKTTEQIISWNWNKQIAKKRVLGTNISYVNRMNTYYGFKSATDLNITPWKGANLIGKGSFLQSKGEIQKSQFLRHLVTLNQKIWVKPAP